MIVFQLICAAEHQFEGWFASAGDFDSQHECGMLACPSCGSPQVRKLLLAKIGRADAKEHPEAPLPGKMTAKAALPDLSQLIDHILLTTEDVGVDFASEARRMHAREVPARGIRGQASAEESEALKGEGIQVFSLPIPPKGSWN